MRDHSRAGHLSFIGNLLRAHRFHAQTRTPSHDQEERRWTPLAGGRECVRGVECQRYERCISIGFRVGLAPQRAWRTESIDALGTFFFQVRLQPFEDFRPIGPPPRERGSTGHEQEQKQRGLGGQP